MERTIRHEVSSAGDAADAGQEVHAFRDYGLWARVANVVLGSWLFASAFLLPHSADSGANTWIVGALVVIFSLWSVWVPPLRRLNTAAAIWLVASVAALPYPDPTRVHNVLLGFAVLALSLVPNRPIRTRAYV